MMRWTVSAFLIVEESRRHACLERGCVRAGRTRTAVGKLLTRPQAPPDGRLSPLEEVAQHMDALTLELCLNLFFPVFHNAGL